MGIHTSSKGEKYLVFEYIDGGNLVDYLVAKQNQLTLKDLLDM
jgi:hypothetical protein